MLTTPRLSPVVEFDSSTRPQEFQLALDRYLVSYRNAQRDRCSAAEPRSWNAGRSSCSWLFSRTVRWLERRAASAIASAHYSRLLTPQPDAAGILEDIVNNRSASPAYRSPELVLPEPPLP